MKKKKDDHQFLPDLQQQGKEEFYLDIDRMVNEGMSGGSVHMREDSTNIDEAIDLFPEDPPNIIE
jgi:hypothetical protein